MFSQVCVKNSVHGGRVYTHTPLGIHPRHTHTHTEADTPLPDGHCSGRCTSTGRHSCHICKYSIIKFRRLSVIKQRNLTSTTVITTRHNRRVLRKSTGGRRRVHCRRLTSIPAVIVIVFRTDLERSASSYLKSKWKKD